MRRATLGTLPPLSLADARELAREALRQAALGHDPASARRQAREALTVAGLVKDYVEAGQGRRSAATNGDYGRTLKGLIQPSVLGPLAAQGKDLQHRVMTEVVWRPRGRGAGVGPVDGCSLM